MFRFLLTLAITATSLLGPMPCCCTLAFARPVAAETPAAPCCCCCLAQNSESTSDSNSSARLTAPNSRCRCDQSKTAEPLAVAKSESKPWLQLAVNILASGFQLPVDVFATSLIVSDSSGSHYLSGRALLRALHVMRC